ncbi:MerR family DNA-binding transcriptional regulator [Phyllobacterium salinisoli]|uniref:MerR family DNA-binding transcriptional regulator n=2 Tax=Phyllobacterium salinisoli TaxID=1899321 RepID=A0A368K736_9HYPH|nr:MerR family DNA-binding transcriptional regulator [Phyllobacterium salinisoli]RCS25176.1 MerR family DNA-binding transcriptional regulator [Phyllobacterium salinisoli]
MLFTDEQHGIAEDKTYRIGDLANEFGVSLRTLRFYEDKGLLNPRRAGTTRLYTRSDRTRLRLVLFGRKVGFTLRELKHLIDLYEPEGANMRQMRAVLDKSTRQLTRLEQQRATLDESIADLREVIEYVLGKMGVTPQAAFS